MLGLRNLFQDRKEHRFGSSLTSGPEGPGRDAMKTLQEIGKIVRESYLREIDRRSGGRDRQLFLYVLSMAQARADRVRTWLLNRYQRKI